jgi:hypothetical protein
MQEATAELLLLLLVLVLLLIQVLKTKEGHITQHFYYLPL